MDLNLTGKTVLITGGSKGLGLATALRFASEGCDLHLAARSEETLAAAADSIRGAYPVKVDTLAIDLAQPGFATRVVDACGEVDILVNNAGDVPSGSIETVDEARWRAGWDSKVFNYINLSREYFARMKARRAGVIVNVIGAAGEKFPGNYIAGAAGNASLMAFTRALGKGAPADGLRVVAINPGPVETDRLIMLRRAEAQQKFGDPEKWRDLTATLPFGRAATPREIGNAVAFLASPLSGYTTGTVLTIDGGG